MPKIGGDFFLVSKLEIKCQKFSVSSRCVRLNQRNSLSHLDNEKNDSHWPLLWISDSPFRVIDGGSCSISLVVNQSLGASFAHTPWPRTSLPSQWLSRRALHIVYTQPENMFCLGTCNMPPFKDWVICFSSDARLPQFAPPDLISRTSYFCQVNSSGRLDRLFLIQGGGGREALSAYVDKHSLHTWGGYFGEGWRIHGLAF